MHCAGAQKVAQSRSSMQGTCKVGSASETTNVLDLLTDTCIRNSEQLKGRMSGPKNRKSLSFQRRIFLAIFKRRWTSLRIQLLFLILGFMVFIKGMGVGRAGRWHTQLQGRIISLQSNRDLPSLRPMRRERELSFSLLSAPMGAGCLCKRWAYLLGQVRRCGEKKRTDFDVTKIIIDQLSGVMLAVAYVPRIEILEY